ncbi:MAG: rod shape-determining protein MreC [Lachnospiraceae bacterium]|nr:rod shape-determining protein MreC [Lachnospiraceae bacterium]
MSEPRRNRGPRGGLMIVIGICLFLMLLSSFSPGFNRVLRDGIGTVLMPMQKGMNRAGSYLSSRIDNLRELGEIREKNEGLKEELGKLREENAKLKLSERELEELRGLLHLREQYQSYESLGAHVIGRSSGNWFQSFLIDKGSRDGLAVGMNVMADGGLVGLVTAVGNNHATVTSIINTGRYVSAMTTRSGSSFLVAGSLDLYADGLLALDSIPLEADVKRGDMVVTSNISDVYLPGLLIGYVEEVKTDSDRLHQSGSLRPVAGFDNLDMVLVITSLKGTGEEP